MQQSSQLKSHPYNNLNQQIPVQSTPNLIINHETQSQNINQNYSKLSSYTQIPTFYTSNSNLQITQSQLLPITNQFSLYHQQHLQTHILSNLIHRSLQQSTQQSTQQQQTIIINNNNNNNNSNNSINSTNSLPQQSNSLIQQSQQTIPNQLINNSSKISNCKKLISNSNNQIICKQCNSGLNLSPDNKNCYKPCTNKNSSFEKCSFCNNGSCIKCQDQYFLSNQGKNGCIKMQQAGCLNKSWNSIVQKQQCIKCAQRFYIIQPQEQAKICKKCSQYCLNCKLQFTCQYCQTGYQLKISQSNSSQCEKINNNQQPNNPINYNIAIIVLSSVCGFLIVSLISFLIIKKCCPQFYQKCIQKVICCKCCKKQQQQQKQKQTDIQKAQKKVSSQSATNILKQQQSNQTMTTYDISNSTGHYKDEFTHNTGVNSIELQNLGVKLKQNKKLQQTRRSSRRSYELSNRCNSGQNSGQNSRQISRSMNIQNSRQISRSMNMQNSRQNSRQVYIQKNGQVYRTNRRHISQQVRDLSTTNNTGQITLIQSNTNCAMIIAPIVRSDD